MYTCCNPGNGKINFEEFLEASMRLNGAARSSDLILLAREMTLEQSCFGFGIQGLGFGVSGFGFRGPGLEC